MSARVSESSSFAVRCEHGVASCTAQARARDASPGTRGAWPTRVKQSGSLRDQGLDDALELVWRQALQLREEGGGVGAGVGDGGPAARLAA